MLNFRKKRPDVFIFGHTHEPGRKNTNKIAPDDRLIQKDIDIWNDGSFIEDKAAGRAGSFIVINDRPESEGSIKLYEVDLQGNVKGKNV